jgi:transcriptional regulator with XRE-family HTH domain
MYRAYMAYHVGMRVGSMIRALREQTGLTQAQLAYRASTTQQWVSEIERDQVSPTVDMLQRLVSACGECLRIEVVDREVPYDDQQLRANLNRPIEQRLELGSSWNRFAGEIAQAGALARAEAKE